MKRLLLLILGAVCFTITPYAQSNQGIDLDLSFSSNSYLIINLGYITQKNLHIKLFIGEQIFVGRKGEDLSNSVGWNEYPNEVIEEGSLYMSYGAGIGYRLKRFVFDINAANNPKVLFRNCYDATESVGKNGKYYMERMASESKFDYGVDAYYLIPVDETTIKIGTGYSHFQKLRFSIGVFHDL